MRRPSSQAVVSVSALVALALYLMSCGGVGGASDSNSGGTGGTTGSPVNGVLMWKGDPSGKGLYGNETTLTTSNVNVSQFGRLGSFLADGLLSAQPLFLANLDMGSAGMHNVIILATEHDSVFALDADNLGAGPLWQRSYLDPTNGVTTLPDIFGGRSAFDGEVGITGTPVIDGATGALYFVTTLARNNVAEQWLRSIDVRTGKDFGAGSVKIQASVPGDGKGSVNGQIPFDPSVQNQRPGLTMLNGQVLVAWGSFSDWGVYHGWLMAFDAKTLQLKATFNPTTQFQAIDDANGPSDHGGGGAFWGGGAAPSIDGGGNIYLNAADGSFNADQAGNNYGDTLLKLQLNGSSFNIQDYFTPVNQACINVADLELGSGGVMLVPSSVGGNLAIALSKEGRLYLVDTANLGKFNLSGNQIPQEFLVGADQCATGMGGSEADGPTWNRLYGNASFWNGNVYAGASNMGLSQFQFQSGLMNPVAIAHSPTSYGWRGGNSVVSANGTSNGIVWVNEKVATTNVGTLHAYDATDVSRELWNSNMNAGRDALGGGIGFAEPVIANGRVIITYDHRVGVYGLLP